MDKITLFIEELEKDAKKKILKEYSLKQKAYLGALIKFLYSTQIDKTELKNLINFYRFDNTYTLEDDLIYNEFKDKLLTLAQKNNITIPENLL